MSAFFRSLSSFAFSFSMDATALLKVSMTCLMWSSSWPLSCQRRACASSATALPRTPAPLPLSCSSFARSVRRWIRRAARAERPATGAPAVCFFSVSEARPAFSAPSASSSPAASSSAGSEVPSSSSSAAAASSMAAPPAASFNSFWYACRSSSLYSKRRSGNSGGASGSSSRSPATQGVEVPSCWSISCRATRSRCTSARTCCRKSRRASTRWLNSVLIACIDSSSRNICRRFFSAFMRWLSGTW
mmetsp:Transcript_96304/g.249078  ORF Transcript_96304/g.249078 Transcript_96304/m.249078 type:complete len:246 (-) Transcript_96304:1493-2230(-)